MAILECKLAFVELQEKEYIRYESLPLETKDGRSIAQIYKSRWQIELLFKALKQNLRVKTFVGTSANALQIQIWTALIALLLLKYLQLRARFGWSLSNLVALLRQQLFVYRELWAWIDHPFQPPPLLANLNPRTPPRSLKMPTFSPLPCPDPG